MCISFAKEEKELCNTHWKQQLEQLKTSRLEGVTFLLPGLIESLGLKKQHAWWHVETLAAWCNVSDVTWRLATSLHLRKEEGAKGYFKIFDARNVC